MTNDMKELNEIRFNESNIQLKDNLVRGGILPEKVSELNRIITIQGDTVIEGAVCAKKIEIENGDTQVKGAVYTQLELHVNSDAKGNISFMKCVASADSVVSMSGSCRLNFHSDVNAKRVSLYNAFVAGSIYADNISLENCVVIGGVFATQQLELSNCVVGTFNAPSVRISQIIQLLLPSAFSVEKVAPAPGTRLYNLSLADLGSLFKGLDQSPESGKIAIDPFADEQTTTLTDGNIQKTLRCYSVIGKVLAADLIDMDKFQNHFLLTAASLGPQLLTTYNLGVDASGKSVDMSFERIRDFFFNIMLGKIEVQDMNGSFNITDITRTV